MPLQHRAWLPKLFKVFASLFLSCPFHRRITMTRPLEEALFQHFIHQKLEIAYAINKPFPFFEGLRDNNFITDTLYRESLEACRNLVPVSRVVYNILTKLEKTFSLSFLEMLFGHINLYEYPSLMAVFKSFKNVVTSHRGWSRSAAAPQEAPASTAERSSVRPLLPLPACQGPPPTSGVSGDLRAWPGRCCRRSSW
uniref:SP110 nuclear body protein n=2 Tax=Sus scrofa TaxID=9823 RepID=A0A4X1TMK6_PIG